MDQPQSSTEKPGLLERWFLLKISVLIGVVGGGLLCAVLGALYGWLFVESPELGTGVVDGVKNGFFTGAGVGLVAGIIFGLRLRMNPLTAKKVQRFRSIKRGFWSYAILMAAFIIAIFGEAFVGHRALVVSNNGSLHFPFLPFADIRTGQDFGLEKNWKGQSYEFEANYLELRAHFQREDKGNWLWMPLVEFNPGKFTDLPHRGRFVRVTLPGKNRVLGLKGFRVTDHNSTYGGSEGAKLSSLAAAAAPAFLTTQSDSPWIELDLGGLRYVEDVRLSLPAMEHEALRAEWKRFTVQLLDEQRAVVWESHEESAMAPAGFDRRIRLIAHPSPPSRAYGHYLGTDENGYDILANVFYGFRIAMIFALGFVMMVYLIGVVIGCLMGYFGGWVDLIGQRGVEIWQNIPFLYMVIIVAATVQDLPFNLPTWFRIAVLLGIMVLFSWTSMTYYMRTAVYREKARDYVAAAQLLGASTPRILFNHLMPNTISTMVTFMPFTVATAIISVTALDYLGLGLPIGTPSWGALLKQGVGFAKQAPWIVLSAFGAMVMVLTLVTFIGEAVREAFDPKKFTTYE
jgi:microcin C transport system permease protein